MAVYRDKQYEFEMRCIVMSQQEQQELEKVDGMVELDWEHIRRWCMIKLEEAQRMQERTLAEMCEDGMAVGIVSKADIARVYADLRSDTQAIRVYQELLGSIRLGAEYGVLSIVGNV